MSTRWRRLMVVVASCLIVLAGPLGGLEGQVPPLDDPEEDPLRCSIDHAHARVFSQVNEGGRVVYYGHALMQTSGCQDQDWSVGPTGSVGSVGSVSVTFEPVAGSTTSCNPQPSTRGDEPQGEFDDYSGTIVCTTGLGAALKDTQVRITAQGQRAGVQGLSAFRSSCSIVLPTMHSISCVFPVEDSPTS